VFTRPVVVVEPTGSFELVAAYTAPVGVPLPEGLDMASWTPDDDPSAKDERWIPLADGGQWVAAFSPEKPCGAT
jgi:hypothetical protein